jgi:tetratricopeptide (TPR) repeat protein
MLINNGKSIETSSMIALSWLIVPFIPASGVLLRLGTLLAERLLYIPSIGYCMIFASIILQCCQSIETLIAKKQYMKKHALFYFVISIICAKYILLSRSYNTAWKNDASLFEYAITVCPRSAKLNLQLGKLYMNNGNYSVANKYVQMAKQIDPDFCDVGYQEALLEIFYENNIDDSIELAANNLNCIYTSRQSVELLNKLWEIQLQGTTDNKHEVLASQALLAFKRYIITIKLFSLLLLTIVVV